jgi:hypothetical protein
MMNTRTKTALIAAVATIAFSIGISVAAAETLACRKCQQAFQACLASGTDWQICYDNDEVCRVRSGCWVD